MSVLLTRIPLTCILFFLLAPSCLQSNPQPFLQLPSGERFKVRIADTPQKQTHGLSGIKSKDFDSREGMLFLYKSSQNRSFWMPDTWFDLDIFFLNENLTVTALERKLPQHPGHAIPPPIARTSSHFSRHVLEIKSGTPLSSKIFVGTKLKALFDHPLLQRELKTHREQ